MTEASDLAKYASKANAVFNSISANSTAITSMSVGGASINATSFAGTANNATNLGGVAAASYQLNSTLSANVATLAANSSSYANASVTNTFTVGTAAYFVSNGNVGIGTSSPDSTRALTLNRTENYGGIEFQVNGSTQARLQQESTGSLYIDSGITTTTGSTIFRTANGSERMRIDSSGNVGIGTSSPSEKLSVHSAVGIRGSDFSSLSYFGSTVNTTGVYTGLDSGGGYVINVRDAGYQAFSTNNTERLRINSSGNVGIGNTTPVNKLHVTGDTSISTSLYLGATTTVGSAAQLSMQGYNAGGGTGYHQLFAFYNTYGSATNPYKYIRLNPSGGIEVINSAYSAVIFTMANDGVLTASGSHRAPGFVDTDDTNSGFYGNELYMRGGSPTIFLRDTDHNSAMIHVNSNLFYVLRGATDSTTWTQVNGQWPLYINLTNNDNVCGGAFSAVGNITAYASDKRLKENIKEIPNAIEKLKKIRGVTFDWNDKIDSLGFTPKQKYNDVGVIAQEIEEVMPQVVTLAPFDIEYDEADRSIMKSKSGENYKTVQYERVVPLLIQAIKEQQAQIEALQTKIMGN